MDNMTPATRPESSIMIRFDQEALAAIADNMSGETLSPNDLDRIKVPSGGGLSWEVQTLDGPKSTKELRGVILMSQSGRAYFPEEYSGKKNPPECVSLDSLNGHGKPGGLCIQCPFNQYESAAKGKGKACKETRTVLILLEGDLLPTIVRVPPSSLKPWRSYIMRLSKSGVRFQHVVTSLSLTKSKSSDGIDYSEIVFASAGVLPTEQRAMIDDYIARFGSAFAKAHAESVADSAPEGGATEPTTKNPFDEQ